MRTTPRRRLTAIIYLVPPDWDAAPTCDGGRLVWWVPEHSAEARWLPGGRLPQSSGAEPAPKHAVDPRCGRLVLFDARLVMHEVLPTHRKRFAVTLWFYRARTQVEEASVESQAPPWENFGVKPSQPAVA